MYSYLNELTEEPVMLKVKREGREETIAYAPDVSVRYLLGFNRSDTASMEVESLIPECLWQMREFSREM